MAPILTFSKSFHLFNGRQAGHITKWSILTISFSYERIRIEKRPQNIYTRSTISCLFHAIMNLSVDLILGKQVVKSFPFIWSSGTFQKILSKVIKNICKKISCFFVIWLQLFVTKPLLCNSKKLIFDSRDFLYLTVFGKGWIYITPGPDLQNPKATTRAQIKLKTQKATAADATANGDRLGDIPQKDMITWIAQKTKSAKTNLLYGGILAKV